MALILQGASLQDLGGRPDAPTRALRLRPGAGTPLTSFATGRSSARRRDTEPRCGGNEDKTVNEPASFPTTRSRWSAWPASSRAPTIFRRSGSNLRRGKESIVTLSDQELRDAGVSEKTLADPAYVRRAPLLDGIDEFDADFFGFPPLAARVLDPQHRLFLQCAWHALEDADCDPARFDGSIGVYGTSSPSGYLLHNLLSHRDPNAVLAEDSTSTRSPCSCRNEEVICGRLRMCRLAFNLRGPSVADRRTACSSLALVAVHLACLSLLSGECRTSR